MRKRARATAIVLLAIMSAACSGPQRSLQVGMKEIETDVLIGPRSTRVQTPPPASDPIVGFPGFVQPPFVPPPTLRPPTPTCPTAGPFDPVRSEVSTTAERPPVPSAYSYRNDGTFAIGDRSGSFASPSTRVIGNVIDPAPGGGFTFDVAIPSPDDSVTTTTYHVFPRAASPTDPEPGLFIERVTTKRADGSSEVFSPVPMLMMIRFPAAIGETWDARGIDPLAGIVMQFTGTIRARGIVDACGVRLAAWEVVISDGLIRGPDRDLTFSSVLWIAPQYGGLSLADQVRTQGTDAGVAIKTSNIARISDVPERP